MIAQAVTEHAQPGIAAAVFRDSGIVAVAATGVRAMESDARITTRDRMHVGSCTKSMTAVIVGMLVEEGLLRWDMTLGEALPALAASMNESYRAVPLELMLHHRAGLPAFTAGAAPEFELTKDLKGSPAEQRLEFARRLLSRPPADAPGSHFVYSNADYAVAAVITEQATGKSWEDLLQQRLFEPLNMNDSGFGWPATPERPDQPLGHAAAADGLRPLPVDHAYHLPACLAPSGDVHCSIEDFARYGVFHLRGLHALDPLDGGRPLLSPRTFAKLHQPFGEYAMGWVAAKRGDAQLTWHNGSAGTFFALITLDPDRNCGVVVIANAGTGSKACEAVTKTLLDRFAPRTQTP